MTNALRIFEKETVRKIYRLVKGGGCWKIGTKKEIKGHITSDRYRKIYKIPPTKVV